MRSRIILRQVLWGLLLLLLGCAENSREKKDLTERPSGTRLTEDTLLSVTGSKNEDNKELVQIYSQAISNFILQVRKEYSLSFDTLFFGKHLSGQEDDFPDIQLPSCIEHTEIRLISTEEGIMKQRENPSSFYINMMGWVDKQKASFILVAFSQGMAHQFDDYLDYEYRANDRGYFLLKYRFENFLYHRN